MPYQDYLRICRTFRLEVLNVRRKSKFQQRKAVDLMKMAKLMDDHRSSLDIVGCTHQMLRLWRPRYA